MMSLVLFPSGASNPVPASGAKAIRKPQVIRKLVLAKAVLLFSITAFCSTAPPTAFQSVLWEDHPAAYCTQHAEEWKAYVNNPCAEENAWVDYYKFVQYANRFDQGNYDLNAIEKEAEAAGMPADGFALPYLKFANNKDPDTWLSLRVCPMRWVGLGC